MPVIEKDLGAVSAYAIAVENGYTGSEEEFALLQVESANNAQAAETARSGAESAASNAAGSAQTAQNAANSAGAAQTAAESAKTAAETANTSAQNAQTAAQQAAMDAQSAQTAAQTSATEAESSAVRAENAAGTVESIVAGNEAYTKRESDLRFAVPIVEGASGAVVAVTDSAERPLQGLKLFGKTTQDGTPTPDAPVPLESVGESGSVGMTVCGKNLIDYTAMTKQSVTADGSIENVDSARLSGFIPVTTDYVTASCILLDGKTNASGYRIIGYDEDKNFLGRMMKSNVSVHSFQISAYAYIRLCFFADEVDEATVQFELGETATEFEPYKDGGSLTISTLNGLPGIPVTSGGNYTDESGQQWICDEVDFGRGVYVQRVKTKVFDGTEDTWGASSTGISGVVRMSMLLPDLKETGPAIIGNIICSHYPTVSAYNTWDGIPGVCVQTINNRNNLFFLDRDIQTLAGWKSFLSEQYAAGTPVTIQYALATPIETPLSAEELDAYAALHTNYPNTTVFNDAGAEMEVKYAADTKLYIDNKFAALSAALSANQTEEVTT